MDQAEKKPTKYINNGRWRRAAKQHQCWECKQPIERHYQYWEDYTETPSYQSGDRYCITCIEAGKTGNLVDPYTRPGNERNTFTT